MTRAGKPTARAVLRALRLLQHSRIRHDVLCVVHEGNVGSPLRLYRFFKDLGVRSLQFLPLVEASPESLRGVSAASVPADAFGAFLCEIFDEWIRHDVGRVTVQTFDEALRTACGVEHALCIFRERCGDVPVLEHNGDFYACDHFVDPDHRFGNIRDTPLRALLACPAQLAFGRAKQDLLPHVCRQCESLAFCNGGCPKDRFLRTEDGEGGLNYLCAAYRRFFRHCRPGLARLAALWRAGQPPTGVMAWARAASVQRGPPAGRNAPCPCGSGLKYKKCCLGRRASPEA